MTTKYRGSAHWNYDINLRLTRKVPVIFHNLGGCDSHLIMDEIGKFDVKANVIQNGLEKYMAFIINHIKQQVILHYIFMLQITARNL